MFRHTWVYPKRWPEVLAILDKDFPDKAKVAAMAPSSDYELFIKKGNFYRDGIVQYAYEIQIHPGIVVGRLQHKGYIKRELHNRLRVHCDWK